MLPHPSGALGIELQSRCACLVLCGRHLCPRIRRHPRSTTRVWPSPLLLVVAHGYLRRPVPGRPRSLGVVLAIPDRHGSRCSKACSGRAPTDATLEYTNGLKCPPNPNTFLLLPCVSLAAPLQLWSRERSGGSAHFGHVAPVCWFPFVALCTMVRSFPQVREYNGPSVPSGTRLIGAATLRGGKCGFRFHRVGVSRSRRSNFVPPVRCLDMNHSFTQLRPSICDFWIPKIPWSAKFRAQCADPFLPKVRATDIAREMGELALPSHQTLRV